MPIKIFVNYRRDDARDMAARVRDRLTATFGDANVFMDVDNLLAGQRFDKELEKALNQTGVFLAVIGSRWLELLAERQANGERDYVREEIAGALQRGIVVIPVLIERTPLPRADALPEDIRDLVLHQKHVVTHERYGRDLAELAHAIKRIREKPPERRDTDIPWDRIGWITVAVSILLIVAIWAGQAMVPPAAQPITDIEGDNPFLKFASPALRRAQAVPLTAAEERALRPKDSFKECSDCPEMVLVPAGSFMMGSPENEPERTADEGPQRRVTIARPFAVGKFEVTFAEWDACVAADGCKHKPEDHGWGRGKRPVINVSWDDITSEYLPWLSRKTGKTYRLLTEAEWEYAARAGATTPYATGHTITKSQANFENPKGTIDVGSFPANTFRLHDMHGNVMEWVQDCWNANYNGAPSDGSARTTGDCSSRVLRGGSWNVNPRLLRSADRGSFQLDFRYVNLGFRLARTLNP